MLTVPETIKDLLHQDTCRKNIRIHFPNGERSDICNNLIVKDSISFTESLCSQETLKFGLCEAPIFECETVGVGNIKGATIEVNVEIFCDPDVAGSEWKVDLQAYVYAIPYGTFVVNSCQRQADLIHRRIVAYGLLSTVDFSYKDHSHYTMMPIAGRNYYGSEAIATLLQTDSLLISPTYASVTVQKNTGYANHYGFFMADLDDQAFQYGYCVALDDDLNASGSVTCDYITTDSAGQNPLVVQNNMKRIFSPCYYNNVYPVYANANDAKKLQKLSNFPYLDYRAKVAEYKTAVSNFFSQYSEVTTYDKTENSKRISGSSVLPYTILNITQDYTDEKNGGGRLWFESVYTDEYDTVPVSNHVMWIYQYPRYVQRFDFGLIKDFSRGYYEGSVTEAVYVWNNNKDDYVQVELGRYDPAGMFWTIKHNLMDLLRANSISFSQYSNAMDECDGNITYIYRSDNETNITSAKIELVTSSNYGGPYTYDEIMAVDFRDLTNAVVELKGMFLQYARGGDQVVFVDIREKFGLLPANNLYPRPNLYPQGVTGGKLLPDDYQSCWYDDQYTLPFGAVYCEYKNQNNEDAALMMYLTGYDESTPGDLYQTYDISDNAFIELFQYSQAQIITLLQPVAAELENVTYMPVEFVGRGLPYVEAGDTFEILTKSNDSITTIVLHRILTGDQTLTDTYKSNGA